MPTFNPRFKGNPNTNAAGRGQAPEATSIGKRREDIETPAEKARREKAERAKKQAKLF